MLTPSTLRLATWSNSLRAQRRPLYAVPVFVLSVPPQTVQRYRRRRPDFVANEPWPTMLRPGFPRLSHPGLAHAIPSIAFIAQVYRGPKPVVSPTSSEVKVTDQQRPAQAPVEPRLGERPQPPHRLGIVLISIVPAPENSLCDNVSLFGGKAKQPLCLSSVLPNTVAKEIGATHDNQPAFRLRVRKRLRNLWA